MLSWSVSCDAVNKVKKEVARTVAIIREEFHAYVKMP